MFQWECVESKGWYGFRNVASGTYLGHERGREGDRMVATAPHHMADEYLALRPHREGGYQILTRNNGNNDPDQLMVMDANSKGFAFRKENSGLRVHFTKVQDQDVRMQKDFNVGITG
jgi:hypothetical protein